MMMKTRFSRASKRKAENEIISMRGLKVEARDERFRNLSGKSNERYNYGSAQVSHHESLSDERPIFGEMNNFGTPNSYNYKK